MTSLIAAAGFTWLGMVLAISFLEAPLKFRAPGLTVAVGLGIGRIVFRALNAVEPVLAAVITTAAAAGGAAMTLLISALAPAALLAVQLIAPRPALTRRSDRILAGEELPHSRMHWVYIALEAVKVAPCCGSGQPQ
jgi:hypothetical protein